MFDQRESNSWSIEFRIRDKNLAEDMTQRFQYDFESQQNVAGEHAGRCSTPGGPPRKDLQHSDRKRTGNTGD